MFVLFMNRHITSESLLPSKGIFLRPTPWKVAWQAGFSYLRREKKFGFVYLPNELSAPNFDFRLQNNDLTVFQNNREVARIPTLPLSFWVWVFYGVESFAYGFFERFWAWRWDAGTLTKQELQAKVEQLEQQIQEFLDRE